MHVYSMVMHDCASFFLLGIFVRFVQMVNRLLFLQSVNNVFKASSILNQIVYEILLIFEKGDD